MGHADICDVLSKFVTRLLERGLSAETMVLGVHGRDALPR